MVAGESYPVGIDGFWFGCFGGLFGASPAASAAPTAAEGCGDPPRPKAPFGAAGNVSIPSIGADGVRHTILVDSVDSQLVWNLRAECCRAQL
jgi:hypothetical protein